MRVLIFAGAGTSVELGVPAMAGMAREFLAHCEQWNVEPDLVKKLMSDTLDIEYLIESLDKICDAGTPLQLMADVSTAIDYADTIRSEVEWFVQHMAERVTRLDAALMWKAVLACTDTHDLTFVTTNYDRAIEIAANASGTTLLDGFEQFSGGEIAQWKGFTATSDLPTLIKLHGSTDWYSDSESRIPVKLRHPMPLFGKGELVLASGEQLGSALILPSREKLLTKAPYLRLSQSFLNESDNCEMAIFIGSSLRDEHISEAAKSIAAKHPVFIVSPAKDCSTIEGAKYIYETASRFLMSTLPAALADSDPASVLERQTADEDDNSSIMDFMRRAVDVQEDTERRCEAIDRLDQLSVRLGKTHLLNLLGDDDRIVSRYSLGLVASSPHKKELIKMAKQLPHSSDNEFVEELSLLQKLVD